MKKVRIGLIGAMGRGAMIGKLFNETGRAETVAVCDINPAAFETGKERFEAGGARPQRYTDAAEMLKRDDLDWVVIGTPDRTHHALGRQVILAGKNVFIEKPMTQTTAEANDICKLVARKRVKVVVGFELRYSPMAMTFRKAIAAGKIGRPIIGTLVDHLGRGYTYFLRDHRKKEWGRGLLMQKGVHQFDLANYWVDSDPVRVFASGGLDYFGRMKGSKNLYCRDCRKRKSCKFSFYTVPSDQWKKHGPREKGEHAFDHCVWMPDTDADDNMHVLVDYESGFRLTYTSVFFATTYNRHEVFFWGDEGSLHGIMDGKGSRVAFQPIGGEKDRKIEELKIEVPVGTHGGGDRAFINAIVDAGFKDKFVGANEWDGRAATALAEFGLKSIETGKPYDIKPRPKAASTKRRSK